MPRPRVGVLFKLGDQWISHERGTKKLYRFWTEPGTGRTRRASLGTEDLQEAIVKFAVLVREASPKSKTSSLGLVLQTYFGEHAANLPSSKVVQSHIGKLVAFIGAATPVESITERIQKEFVERCLEDGNKLAYAARIMTTLSAALAHSKIREPEIIYTESAMIRLWKVAGSPKKKAYIPTDEECAQLVVLEMPVMLRRWMIIQAMTAGRPQTAVDLEPAQFNREVSVVDLNPVHRSQNKKHRAKVKAGRALRYLLTRWETAGLNAFGGKYCGYSSMEGVKSGVQRIAAETGIPISTYSWRQKATTVLRRARVPEDQVSDLLGHKRPNLRTTAGYGDWDPDYQREAAAALDGWFWRIRKLAKHLRAHMNSQGTPKAEARRGTSHQLNHRNN